MSDFSLRDAKKKLLQMHFESGVGHVGGNLSALDSIMVIFHKYLHRNDKFVLSKGHSVGAVYVALWSKGLLSDSDLKTFHGEGTSLPGHPPSRGKGSLTFATGSLGHGLSLAAGLALSNKFTKNNFEVICFMSDGEWQEGSTWEGLIFATHHNLGNLTVVIDQNDLQGFGTTTEVASMSNLAQKLENFNVELQIVDGHNLVQIEEALKRKISKKVRIIILKTIKGHGVKQFENKMDSHYLPLSENQFLEAQKILDLI